VMGSYGTRPERLAVSSRVAKSAKSLRRRTRGRLYSCDPLLEGLAQHLEDVAAELWPFIEKEHAMVCQRHVARHRHLAPTDQAHIGDRVMGGATRVCGDDRGAAGDAVDASGVKGFGYRLPGDLEGEGQEPVQARDR